MRGSYVSWQWRMIQNLKRNWLSVQNWHEEFDKFWPEHSKIWKISTLIGCFRPKQIMFELKKYRGVCFMALNILCSKHNSSEMAIQFYFKFCIILYQMVQISRFFWEPLDLTTVLPISSIKRSSPEFLIL